MAHGREETMKKYLGRKVLASAVAISTLGLLQSAPANAQEKALTFGSSSIGSVFYVMSVGMAEMLGKHEKISVTVQPVGGSYPNLFALASGKVDILMANSLSQYDRYHGNAPFKKPFDVRIIAQGQPNFRVILVRKSAKISSVADLAGKTVIGKRRALPELEKIVSALLKVHNVPANKVKIVDTVNSGQVGKALRAGSVDAAAYPAALRQPLLTALLQDNVVEFLDINAAKRDEMLKLLPAAFYPASFKPDSFAGQKKEIHVFGLNTALATRAGLSAETVYKIAKTILGNTKEFAKYHPSARQWTVKQSLSNPSVPYHDGAIRYYKEIGAWTPQMQALQDKLLKR
jgi:TRAP transporter TAXI family solute receptor